MLINSSLMIIHTHTHISDHVINQTTVEFLCGLEIHLLFVAWILYCHLLKTDWFCCPLDYNLYWVLAHELGHSFGLSHSTNIGALMYPNCIYAGEVYLSQDDINGIQAIYGKWSWVNQTKACEHVCFKYSSNDLGPWKTLHHIYIWGQCSI